MKLSLAVLALLLVGARAANLHPPAAAPKPVSDVKAPEERAEMIPVAVDDIVDDEEDDSVKLMAKHMEAIKVNAKLIQENEGLRGDMDPEKLKMDLETLSKVESADLVDKTLDVETAQKVKQLLDENVKAKSSIQVNEALDQLGVQTDQDHPEEDIRVGMTTLDNLRDPPAPSISPVRLITLGIQALMNTIRHSGGLYGRVREDVLWDIQDQINQQKALEMQIVLDGYKATLLHLQTLLGLSSHWTFEDINNYLKGNPDPILEEELSQVEMTTLFMLDLNNFYHTILNDKHVFVLRAPGETATALTSYSEYAMTNLYINQAMIELSIYNNEEPAQTSYERQFKESSDYHYRYLQFCIAKTAYFLDRTQGNYKDTYLRRQAYFNEQLEGLTLFFSIPELRKTAYGSMEQDESLFIRQGDVVAFMRVYDTKYFDQWLGCYNGGKNCGTSSCPGSDQPFEDLQQLPCSGEIYQIYAEHEGYILNSDAVAVNYNNGVVKGSRWYWLARPNTGRPDTRDCPGSSFTSGTPFDTTCEFERLRVWAPQRPSGERLQDRDLVFFERQNDASRYLEVGGSSKPSMYRIYRHGSVYKGVAYWTE